MKSTKKSPRLIETFATEINVWGSICCNCFWPAFANIVDATGYVKCLKIRKVVK